MRCPIVVLSLALAAAVFAPALGHGQTKEQKEPIRIERISVGLPDGRKSEHGKYKSAFWAPVYVDLVIGPQDIPAGEAVLIVETPDSDGILNQYSKPLPALPKKQSVAGLITYVRPGNLSSEITLTVALNNRTAARMRIAPGSDMDAVDNGGVLWLTMGAKLPGLQRALAPRPNQPEGQAEENVLDDDLMDSNLRRFAAIDQLEQMPTRWFGYQAVDVLVLTSSNADFIIRLNADRAGRVEALTEWVRRGGRMIISAGHNQQLVDKLLARMKLMHSTLAGAITRPRLVGFQTVTPHRDRFEPTGGVEIAKLVPSAGVGLLDDNLLEKADARDPEPRPLAVQAGCGLGRVLLIACDLDAPPFTAWKGQADFWRFLQSKIEPHLNARDDDLNSGRFGMRTVDTNELAGQLQNSLEKFGDITVISFGWVALFILIYIIIIGPLDYLFLKRVVKRLELTWITFPVVVLVVSAAAYFTAYYLKGNDLKINKLDVIDIDLTPAVDATEPPPRIYGSTWFTLFSPRIQHYTIGVEPADGGWGGGKDSTASTVVGWMGRPDDSHGGTGRAGSTSLFRRSYEYAPDAAGLVGVPIQVWATKSFSASWVCPASVDAPFAADLKHPPADEKKVIGTVTNNLPADLVDVVVLYQGNVYPQGRLDAGVPKRVDFTGMQQGLRDWMNESFPIAPRPGISNDDLLGFTSTALKGLLFHDRADASQGRQNTALRQLDQGWRLKDRDEVVLLGRVQARAGDGVAETVATDPGTPSRLWLGALPGAGPRPKLEGTLTQRTFVRVYIPINSQR